MSFRSFLPRLASCHRLTALSFLHVDTAAAARVRVEKPSNMYLLPKHPLSAFTAFFTRQRNTIKAEHPYASPTEVMSLASRRWAELDPAEKQPWLDAAQADKDAWSAKRNVIAVANSKAALAQLMSSDQVSDLRAVSKGRRIYLALHRAKRLDVIHDVLGCPRRPGASTWHVYCSENKLLQQKADADKATKRTLREQYRELDPERREELDARFRDLIERHSAEKRDWLMRVGRDPRFAPLKGTTPTAEEVLALISDRAPDKSKDKT